MKHAELIARLEAAEVGNEDMDREVYLAHGDKPVLTYDGAHFYVHHIAGLGKHWPIPRYTTSLDAALALAERVLPVFKYWALGTNGGEEFVATVAASSTAPHGCDGVAQTPALALCIAILKTLEAKRCD